MELVEAGQEEPRAVEAAQPSNFATKLLSLWAHGKVSAAEVQRLSHLANLDGCTHPEIALLASAGNYGEQPGNCHRALLRSFCQKVSVAEPFLHACKSFDPKTSKDCIEEIAVFMPHLHFSTLAVAYPEAFEKIFQVSQLSDFWEEALARHDDRLVDHPATLDKGWEHCTIPLFLHGDGVEYESRDSLMVWSFGGFLSQENSLDSHLLLAAHPKTCTTKETWPQIWKVLAWSFKALAKGQRPKEDWEGQPLEKGSPFFEARGRPLAGNLRAIVWAIEGDHDFFSNSLYLPHWKNWNPCWQCDATQAGGEKPFQTLDMDIFTEVDHAWASTWPTSHHPLFTEVDGVSSRMVRGDGLHILFTKGVYAHLLGSILHYCCWYDTEAQVVKPCQRLGIIFKEIQEVYKEQKTSCRLTNLVLKMFTNPQSPWKDWAFLSTKGAEGKHLAPALLKVCKNLLDGSREEHFHMITCLQCMCEVVQIWDEAGLFLTKSEYKKAWQKAQQCMSEYQWLEAWSKDNDRKSFHIVNKHHSFLHLAKDAWYINPRFHWCFKAEDFVGHISTLTHSVSMGVRATKLSQKLAPKYRILLHLLYTRPGFRLETSSDP